MDELDVKKSGLDEINFQARSFGRLLEKADILHTTNVDGIITSRMFINSDKNITIDVVSFDVYKSVTRDTDKHIVNDRKILEVAQYVNTKHSNAKFISNDVMCRLRAISLGLTTEVMGKNIKDDIALYTELEYEGVLPSAVEAVKLTVEDTIHGLCLYNDSGDRKYYYKSGMTFHVIDEDELKRQNIKPQNIEQKIYASLILDPFYDVIVSDAPAGSGKTLIALSCAMKLIDTKLSPYDKIVYMRKTVNADNEEMGFLPGSADEKLSPYLAPLYSNLEAIVQAKYKKKFTQEELQSKIEDIVKDYNITPMFEGFLRGTNIRNAIVIVDEIQNESVASIRTSFTRVTDGCKLIAVGSNRQIDNKYVNKHTSALTYLNNKIGKDNKEVNVGGICLTKTVRGKIADWADSFS